MRMKTSLGPMVLGAFVLALAGCEHGYYAGSVSYHEGGGPVVAPAPPPPPVEGYTPEGAEGGVAVSAGGGTVDVSLFYSSLAPYGRWVEVPQYGRCFIPAGVGPGWRPYTLGHWEYTDYGWTWVSDEPFGWATCHYGGWVMVPQYGWAWVPGTHWGPAWVSWREGGGYVGWAPLPPHHGVDISVSFTRGIPADHYTFVDERYVTASEIHQHVVNVRQNTTIINKTTNITNIKTVNNKVVNQSLSVAKVEKVTGRKIQPKVIRTTEKPTKGAIHGNTVEIYHPKIAPKPKPKVETKKPAPKAETKTPAVQPKTIQPTPPHANVQPGAVQPPHTTAEPKVNPKAVTPKSYELERQKLEQQHARELKDLQARHAKELQNRPANRAELLKRHEAEVKALQHKHAQEQEQLKKKHNIK